MSRLARQIKNTNDGLRVVIKASDLPADGSPLVIDCLCYLEPNGKFWPKFHMTIDAPRTVELIPLLKGIPAREARKAGA